MTNKKLIRPKKGRVFFGVAAGLGDYFEIDPTIVRLIFVLLTLWGGLGIILYIIGIFLIPDEDENLNQKSNHREVIKKRVQSVAYETRETLKKDGVKQFTGEQIIGLIILIIGLGILFNSFFPWFNFWRLWPLALIIIGMLLLSRAAREEKK